VQFRSFSISSLDFSHYKLVFVKYRRRTLKELLSAGAKGKEIAERLKISESMVKKLKREYGLSKTRSTLSYALSCNSYKSDIILPMPK